MRTKHFAKGLARLPPVRVWNLTIVSRNWLDLNTDDVPLEFLNSTSSFGLCSPSLSFGSFQLIEDLLSSFWPIFSLDKLGQEKNTRLGQGGLFLRILETLFIASEGKSFLMFTKRWSKSKIFLCHPSPKEKYLVFGSYFIPYWVIFTYNRAF